MFSPLYISTDTLNESLPLTYVSNYIIEQIILYNLIGVLKYQMRPAVHRLTIRVMLLLQLCILMSYQMNFKQ